MVPDDGTPASLELATAGTTRTVQLPMPETAQKLRVGARTSLKFLRDAVACGPDALRHLRLRDAAAKARIKARLGFDTTLVFHRLDPAILPQTPAPRPLADFPLTVIMPIHNGFDIVPEAVARVLDHSAADTRLILVEDASSDPAVRPWLRARAQAEGDRILLLENDTNLGFVGSMNRAFAVALTLPGHVVALNSDALVPEGWAPRLLAPMLADARVATVTAMSNEAEIATAPVICAPAPLPPHAADAIDRVAAGLDPVAACAEAPTGVGFCMAINRTFLDRLPAFDTAFGRGYGEEVDWCQKARALGGRHLISGALYVEHRGGHSFGSAEKQRRVAENNTIISRRYPGYDREVQAFLAADPLVSARLALALAHLNATTPGPTPVYLAHSLGGGAETWLQERVAADLAKGTGSVILRVGGSLAWQIDVVSDTGVTSAGTDERALAERLLGLLDRREVIYSCGVGAVDPRQVPAFLSARARAGDRLQVLFHDFLPLSPSYCLLGADGRYHGVPPDDSPDPAHAYRTGDLLVTLPDWRAMWGGVLRDADDITVFSQASAEIVTQVFPWAADRLKVRPHSLHSAVPRCPAPAAGRAPAIGALGNIGHQKGAGILAEMTAPAQRARPKVGLVVIGQYDLNYPTRRGLSVHGRYQLEDLDRLTGHYGIGCWLIPSIWPETFSYATHEALATGLPVFCAPLGAQAEAVAAAPNGRILRADLHDAAAVLAEIRGHMGWQDAGAVPSAPVLAADTR
jgi:GT2 family glycosyltransferase